MTEIEATKIYSELNSLREELERLSHQVERLRPTVRTDHPHIVRIDGVRGGQPIIRGASVSVRTIVEKTQLDQSSEEIVEEFGGVLTLAQVYDALSYYYEHKAEIDQDIAENRVALWKGPTIHCSSYK